MNGELEAMRDILVRELTAAISNDCLDGIVTVIRDGKPADTILVTWGQAS